MKKKNMGNYLGKFFLMFIWITFVGCSSYQTVSNVRMPYTELRSLVVKNLPLGLRRESANGRTLESNYFSPTKLDEDAHDKRMRAYAEVVINGSSRPYEVKLRVVKEQRIENGAYESLGEDANLSTKLKTFFEDLLANRPDRRNIIDDFRVF